MGTPPLVMRGHFRGQQSEEATLNTPVPVSLSTGAWAGASFPAATRLDVHEPPGAGCLTLLAQEKGEIGSAPKVRSQVTHLHC